MKKLIKYIPVILLMLTLVFASCSKDDPASSTSNCDQTCKDQNSAYGLVHTYNFIWNQYIAGQPAGNKDLTVSGPQGGSIHITGTTAVAGNGINTVHLIYDMTNCKGLDENYSLTFNGIVNIDGTFSSTYKAMGFTSSELSYQGTVGKNVNAPVNGTCALIINETQTHLSGTICGREFSYK